MMDYVWHNGVNVDGIKHQFPFPPYAIPWFGNTKRSVLGLSSLSPVSAQQDAILQVIIKILIFAVAYVSTFV